MNIAPPSLPNKTYERQQVPANRMRHWGIVLLFIGSVWLVFELTGRGTFLWNSLGFIEQTRQTSEVVAGQSLVVHVISDEIMLETWNQPQIRIEATSHAFGWSAADAERILDNMDMQIQQVNDTVSIETIKQPWLHFRRAPYTSFRIALPPQAHFTIQSINGDINVSAVQGEGMLETINGDINLNATHGPLVIRTTNGDLVIRDHSGTLDVTTTNGDVQVSGSQSASITARSTNGDMLFQGITGTIKANTVSGDMTMTDARDAQVDIASVRGDLEFSGSLAQTAQRLHSSAGDIDLHLAPTGNFQLSVETLSGDLESTLDLQQIQQTGRSLNGILGDGGNSLSITTDSGDISLYSQ